MHIISKNALLCKTGVYFYFVKLYSNPRANGYGAFFGFFCLFCLRVLIYCYHQKADFQMVVALVVVVVPVVLVVQGNAADHG